MSTPAGATIDLNGLSLEALYEHLAAGGAVRRLLELARDEDLGFAEPPRRPGDREGDARRGLDVTTAACIAPERRCRAALVARSGGVVSGLAAFPELLRVFAPSCVLAPMARDGGRVAPGATAAEIQGPLDEVLELERTALNLIGRMSGIATRTAEFARAIPAGSRAALYDTRKTTPGMRALEKYAVRCGGGRCHRLGLFDAALIKDNHLAGVPVRGLAAFVRDAATRARAIAALRFVEVEVDTLAQFDALLTLPRGTVEIVLLDNMEPEDLRRAAALRDARAPWLELEASGGVTLATIREIAGTGVDRISVGGLTHGAVSLDVALDVVEAR